MTASTWTETRDSYLRTLWDGERSASEIAAIFGKTKNAIIGRAHRLGFPPRRPTRAARTGPPMSETEARRIIDGALIRLIDRDMKRAACPSIPVKVGGGYFVYGGPLCQWIDGEPSEDDSCKCGVPAPAGQIYCAEHRRRARQPLSALNRANAVAAKSLP